MSSTGLRSMAANSSGVAVRPMAMCSVSMLGVLPWGTATPPPMPVVRVVSRFQIASLNASPSAMSVSRMSTSASAKIAAFLSAGFKRDDHALGLGGCRRVAWRRAGG